VTTQGRSPSEPTRSGPAGAPASTPGVTDKVQDTASRVADTVQETTRPVVDKASETVQQAAERATEQATSRLDMAVDYAAETLTGVAQALRQTGQHLREEGSQPMLGRYADTGAEQIERFSGYLRQHNATELLTEVETYARRNPMTFAGGAFALGLLAARFFRSTGHRPQPSPPPRPALPPGRPSPSVTRSTPPVAVPRYGSGAELATSQPPSYANAAPATRPVPASSEHTGPSSVTPPSTPQTSTSTREAERLTPAPGSLPSAGAATPSPARPGGTTGGPSPSSEREGPGGARRT